MYRIAVCDDEKTFADKLAAAIKDILHKREIPCALDVYYSCDALYQAMSKRELSYHILFLDILMDGMDGMDFSQRLREKDEAATIVFVTSTPQYMKQGYKVGAKRYLEKPLKREELLEILELDYEKRFKKEYIMVRQGFHMRSVALDALICLEASGRKLLYHLPGETIEAYAPSQFEPVYNGLPDNFIRCHRSYIINVNAIREIRRTEAVTVNNMVVPISRGNYQVVQQRLLQYAGQRMVEPVKKPKSRDR